MTGVQTCALPILRVVKAAECGIGRLVPWKVCGEQKRLEKPRGVREVPFGRTGVGHGLQTVILDAKR